MKNKKAYFFSIDALIAVLIILGVVLLIKPQSIQVAQEVELQKDFLSVLSSIKIGELNDSYVEELIENNSITNLNQSVLEQIGEFYAKSQPEATILTNRILTQLNLDDNLGLYFNNNPMGASGNLNFNDATNVWTSRQIISGVDNNQNASKGYSSRAFLFAENRIEYFYFGGYIGDGNITVNLGENALSAKIEAVFSGDFNVSVNNNPEVNYSPVPGIPFGFTISEGFELGTNQIKFTSNNQNLYIAGGFIRTSYNDSSIPQSEYKHKIPGIQGFTNIYDSFYIPGQLNEIEVFLNYSSNYGVFFSIGNKTLYSGNGTNQEITLTNSTLSSEFPDFSELSNKTIPFRFGLENVSYLLSEKRDADVYSVTDLSGSMAGRCLDPSWGCCRYYPCQDDKGVCELCSGTWVDDKLQEAKDANYVFIDAVLNDSDNRVGLVGYESNVDQDDCHDLSKNDLSLKSQVDDWYASGGTCICCGINEAVDRLLDESTNEDFRSLVVMTDGDANVECEEQRGTPDLNGNDVVDDAGDDAIQAACDAYNIYGIQVYAIAFGENADSNTTEAIASCGNGGAYSGDLEDLLQIYEDIAQEILDAAYYEQTIVGEGFETTLFPSSYISVDYEKEIPYGVIVPTESEEFGANTPLGTFILPANATPYEAKVVSYSGSKWTSKVNINHSGWQEIFDLSDYVVDFTELGDPYAVNIPLEYLREGENQIQVFVGVDSSNLSVGSEHNKVIYSVVKNISSFSPIVASAEGCNWTIQFEDDTYTTMLFPENYSGEKNCSYTESLINFNENDAIDYAIFNLLKTLDLNLNQKIETKFEEHDMTINSIEVEGIPFVWETEAQVRVWR